MVSQSWCHVVGASRINSIKLDGNLGARRSAEIDVDQGGRLNAKVIDLVLKKPAMGQNPKTSK
jgi:hypothetical protein